MRCRLYRLSVTIAKAPLRQQKTTKEIIMGELGIWGLIHLAVVIYAAIQIWNSSADQNKKLVWIAVVAIFPLVGLIVWFLMGPGTPKK
jgi:hypothetical protein